MALCLSFAAVTVSAEIVWSSAFDFDGTKDTVEIATTTPIYYSVYLGYVYDNVDSITLTVTDQNDPAIAETLLLINYPDEGETGNYFWNFNDPKYNKKHTFTLQETIVGDKGTTSHTRSVTLAPEPAIVVVLGLVGILFLRRRLKGLLVALLMISLGTFSALADSPVTSVTCQQGWPTSTKVIISFYMTSFSGRRTIKFYGTTDNGATTFDLSEKGTLDGSGSQGYIDGSPYFSKTYTAGWVPDSTFDSVKGKIKIGVEVIDPNDVSDGSSATKYQFISSIPSGVWSDMYKKMEETLKLVPAETFTKKGSSEEKDETQHQVTLIKSSYDGVFDVAQEQCL